MRKLWVASIIGTLFLTMFGWSQNAEQANHPARLAKALDELNKGDVSVSGHSKCTTYGRFKMHHSG